LYSIRQLSLAIPPWVGSMSTGQRAVMLCDWELRHIWCCLQVTLCDPYLSALEAFARKRTIQIHVYFTYTLRSLTFNQCRDLITGVMCENLGDLTTVQAREFWICYLINEDDD